jgi:DNA-binding NtrC family response regulator
MEPRARILVADDESAVRDACRQALQRSGHDVLEAGNGVDGLRTVLQQPIDLVLLDLRMPGLGGVEFLRRVRSERPDLDVIIITGYSSIESAVECMRLGAYDYLTKPFRAEALRLAVDRALEKRRLAVENRALREQLLSGADEGDLLLGRSPGICRVRELIQAVGPTDTTVLVLGESGTGKELVAQAIHRGRAAGEPGRFSRLTAVRWSSRCARATSTATFAAPSPVRSRRDRGASNWRAAAPCFSTRSRTCRSRCRPSCCGSCRSARSYWSEAPRRSW